MVMSAWEARRMQSTGDRTTNGTAMGLRQSCSRGCSSFPENVSTLCTRHLFAEGMAKFVLL